MDDHIDRSLLEVSIGRKALHDSSLLADYLTEINYSPMAVELFKAFVRNNPNGFYLYLIQFKEEDHSHPFHIIWVYKYSEYSAYQTIPTAFWDKVKQSGLMDEINKTLVECSVAANNFYKWKYYKHRGFIIQGSKSFGFEAGNFLGIQVGYIEIKNLFYALESKDVEEIRKIKIHLTASIIHELTHLDSEDRKIVSQFKSEIASHISQFIFEPRNNEIFNHQLSNSLDQIQAISSDSNPDLYDKAQFAALIIVTKKLSEFSEVIKLKLEEDKQTHKINTLRSLGLSIGTSEHKYLIEKVLPQIMEMDDDELVRLFTSIQNEWNFPIMVK